MRRPQMILGFFSYLTESNFWLAQLYLRPNHRNWTTGPNIRRILVKTLPFKPLSLRLRSGHATMSWLSVAEASGYILSEKPPKSKGGA
jgi:hypothetical protein